MEFGAVKFDWNLYQQALARGEFFPAACRVAIQCEGPCEVGSLNAALSDFFPLLAPHLPDDVRNAMGPLVGAIATCGIKDWPWPQEELPIAPEEMANAGIGLIYSPPMVAKIVDSFQRVSPKRMTAEVTAAWPKKSNNPADYQFSANDHFDGPADFLDYVFGWYAPFEEAARTGHGIAIGGG